VSHRPPPSVVGDPAELGLDPERVARLVAKAEQAVLSGRLPSAQIALARAGRLALDHTVGAPADSRYSVFSVTKALTASAVWLLLGDGRLTPETRVAELIEEFSSGGRQNVTVEHLLTHTAGFPRAPMRPEEGGDPVARRARFATWRLESPPGSRTGYSPEAVHWVLADLLERATGRTYRDVIRARVLEPLGLRRLRLGVAADDAADVRTVVTVAAADGAHEAPAGATIDAEHLLRANSPAVRAVGVPGSGAVSTAADVALFYQALLHDPAGVWDPAVLADATGHVRNRLVDPFTRVPANRTLGLTVAGDDGNAVLREFGRESGPRAFGAAGIGGQVAWADPDTGLSFCALTDGLDADLVAAFLRASALSTVACRCVAGPVAAAVP